MPVRRLTTEDFIERAIKIHGDKYDYSKAEYKGYHIDLVIHCPEHGDFQQKPNHHFKGYGCATCSGKLKHTTESFIRKAKKVHGDKYDYDNVDYKNAHTKVIFSCLKHGKWEQTPSNFINGNGCPYCSGAKMNTKSFIEKASKVHKGFYDYSNTVYAGSELKVSISCSLHGEFEQNPSDHLRGRGCIECAGCMKGTTESFIKKARKVHGNTYCYDKVDYKTTNKKVTIICEAHGEFKQTPNRHLSGNNCPECYRANHANGFVKSEYCSKYPEAIFYVIGCERDDEKFYKFGITARTLKERLTGHIPYDWTLLYMNKDDSKVIWDLEKQVGGEVYEHKYKPKLKFGGHTETFKCKESELVDILTSIA